MSLDTNGTRSAREEPSSGDAQHRCIVQKRLVLRHINAVTSAMRTSPRWAQASSSPNALLSSATTNTSALSLTRAACALARSELAPKDAANGHAGSTGGETPDDTRPEPASVGLLGGFTILRAQLRMVTDVANIPLPTLLSHFLNVILSARTSGAVTQVALEAVAAFLDGGLFRASSIELRQAVQDVAHATSHCRFEPSDAGRDEVVLLAILDVMYALVCGRAVTDNGACGPPLVDMLGDESVCELMETCLSMCCQTRLSSALRRTAEDRMHRMLGEVFSRLETMPQSADEAFTESGRAHEPELATLTAARVGADADDDKRLRMMTPDPKSKSIPAAGAAQQPAALEYGDDSEVQEGDKINEGQSEIQDNNDKTEDEKSVRGTQENQAGEEIQHGSDAQPKEQSQEPLQGGESQSAQKTADAEHKPSTESDAPRTAPETPFGLLALKEILRVIISLLDPGSVRHTMTMRILGLSLFGRLLDTHSAFMAKFPSLLALIEDSACRYLFQLANTEHNVLVAHSLRVLTVLFDHLSMHLKMQQELLLLFFVQQLRPTQPWADAPWANDTHPEGPAPLTSFHACATGEMRELFIEALYNHLAVDGGSSVDPFVALWRNYDCDMDCADLYEYVTRFLCRAIFAQPANAASAPRTAPSGLQLVSLDMILGIVERMAVRHEEDGESKVQLSALAETLHTRRKRKALLAAGAAAFNNKPKDGIAFLARENLLAPAGRERARGIARFLFDSPLVDKRLLGDYISRAENVEVLAEFLDLFDFSACDVAEAMRALCEAFRLPGEAQQIARITETFAQKYFATKPEGIRSEDAVYVLAYSIIMLNTDLHNPQVTRRMTINDYQRNLRGVNDGADFDQAYLASIYDGIRRREIVMPEEHAGQLGFDYAWKELLRRSRAGNTLDAALDPTLDADMFRYSWRPFVAAIVHAFATLQDEHLLQRVIAGCRQCAVLARAFDVPEVFDYMVQHLAVATGLLDAHIALEGAVHAAHVEHEGVKLTVSPLSVAFGGQFKQQLAAVVLFTLAHANGSALREALPTLLTCLESLLVNGLLPHGTTRMYVARNTYEPIPLRGASAQSKPGQANADAGGGFLSTISSYFLSPYSGAAPEPMDVTPADVESTLCALDCLASCKINQMHAQMLGMPDSALGTYVAAIYARLEAAPSSGEYSPIPVFWLEQLADIVCERRALLVEHGERVLKTHLERLVNAPRTPPMELERATVGAMRIVGARVQFGDREGAHAALLALLEALRSVPNTLHTYVSSAFLTGVDELVSTESGIPAVTDDEWRTLLHVVASYARVRRAAPARSALALAAHLTSHATRLTYAPLVELVRDTLSSADRALWHGEDHAPRRTLTENRHFSEWISAVHAASLPALDALARVRTRIPALITSAPDPSAAWPDFWLPLVAAFAQPCVSVHRLTRQAAVSHLQHIVLAPEMYTPCAPPAQHVDAMFGNILLPLLETLMAPGTARADTLRPDDDAVAGGITLAETRTQVCVLVMRAWVRHVGTLMDNVPNDVESPQATRVLKLWIGLVHATARLLKAAAAGKQPHAEAVEEQLKNMVLVMHASGHLVDGAPPGSFRRAVWAETWRRVDTVKPDLKGVLKEAKPKEQAIKAEASTPETAKEAEPRPAESSGASHTPAPDAAAPSSHPGDVS